MGICSSNTNNLKKPQNINTEQNVEQIVGQKILLIDSSSSYETSEYTDETIDLNRIDKTVEFGNEIVLIDSLSSNETVDFYEINNSSSEVISDLSNPNEISSSTSYEVIEINNELENVDYYNISESSSSESSSNEEINYKSKSKPKEKYPGPKILKYSKEQFKINWHNTNLQGNFSDKNARYIFKDNIYWKRISEPPFDNCIFWQEVKNNV